MCTKIASSIVKSANNVLKEHSGINDNTKEMKAIMIVLEKTFSSYVNSDDYKGETMKEWLVNKLEKTSIDRQEPLINEEAVEKYNKIYDDIHISEKEIIDLDDYLKDEIFDVDNFLEDNDYICDDGIDDCE